MSSRKQSNGFEIGLIPLVCEAAKDRCLLCHQKELICHTGSSEFFLKTCYLLDI